MREPLPLARQAQPARPAAEGDSPGREMLFRAIRRNTPRAMNCAAPATKAAEFIRRCRPRLLLSPTSNLPPPAPAPYFPIRSSDMNASCGMSTFPTRFMRFFPARCFSSSLRLRVTSPP